MAKTTNTDAPPYATAGELLTCPNGHVVGVFNQDVASGDVVSASDVDWQHPNASSPRSKIAPCAECGEHYFRVNDDGALSAHIGSDWR